MTASKPVCLETDFLKSAMSLSPSTGVYSIVYIYIHVIVICLQGQTTEVTHTKAVILFQHNYMYKYSTE